MVLTVQIMCINSFIIDLMLNFCDILRILISVGSSNVLGTIYSSHEAARQSVVIYSYVRTNSNKIDTNFILEKVVQFTYIHYLNSWFIVKQTGFKFVAWLFFSPINEQHNIQFLRFQVLKSTLFRFYIVRFSVFLISWWNGFVLENGCEFGKSMSILVKCLWNVQFQLCLLAKNIFFFTEKEDLLPFAQY